MGNWLLGNIPPEMETDMFVDKGSRLQSAFQFSIIPLFHVPGKKMEPRKITIISLGCKNFETSNHVMANVGC